MLIPISSGNIPKPIPDRNIICYAIIVFPACSSAHNRTSDIVLRIASSHSMAVFWTHLPLQYSGACLNWCLFCLGKFENFCVNIFFSDYSIELYCRVILKWSDFDLVVQYWNSMNVYEMDITYNAYQLNQCQLNMVACQIDNTLYSYYSPNYRNTTRNLLSIF